MQPGETAIWADCPSHGRLVLSPRDFSLITYQDGTVEPQFECPEDEQIVLLPDNEQAVLSLRQVRVHERTATDDEQRRFFNRHPWELTGKRGAPLGGIPDGGATDDVIARAAQWHPELAFVKRLDFAVRQIVARRIPQELRCWRGESEALDFVPSALVERTRVAAEMLTVVNGRTNSSSSAYGRTDRLHQAMELHDGCSAALTEVRELWREALELSSLCPREKRTDLLWVKTPTLMSAPELDAYIDQLAAEAHNSLQAMTRDSPACEI